MNYGGQSLLIQSLRDGGELSLKDEDPSLLHMIET